MACFAARMIAVRKPYELDAMYIPGSLNVPRGIPESACGWDFEETIPEPVKARHREIVVVCRSGYHSVMAVLSMQVLGYQSVLSLRTGLRGWNDCAQLLVNREGAPVRLGDASEYFTAKLRSEQLKPKAEELA